MTATLDPTNYYWTLEEYYALEKAGDRRYEYWDGEIVCMSGGTKEHGRIIANVISLLANALTNNNCVAFTESQAVKAKVSDSGYVYPDASVACHPAYERHEERGIDLLINPVLIVEVTSKDSGIRDYNPKKEAYQAISSLNDYIIIEPDSRFITHYHRGVGGMGRTGGWSKHIYNEPDDIIEFSNGSKFILRDIYRGIEIG